MALAGSGHEKRQVTSVSTRSWISAKQRHAAKLLMDGLTGFQALRQAGYSKWTARKVGYLLRRSWGLRQAILEEQAARNIRLVPAPKRKKYGPRSVTIDIQNYCFPENAKSYSNSHVQKLYDDTRRVERIVEGLPPKEIPQPPAFMADMTRCPECGRSISRRQLFLGQSGNYVCPRCAGV